MADSEDVTRGSGAFPDDEPPAGPDELAAAERLRRALDGDGVDRDADLARALRLAHAPPALDPARGRAILDAALEKHAPHRGGRVLRVVFGSALTLTAAAAGVALAIGGSHHDSAPEAASRVAAAGASALIASRSTEELFAEKFAPIGGTSARVDRIALAREQDFRANRFARWGSR